jgi:hypothetical protein
MLSGTIPVAIHNLVPTLLGVHHYQDVFEQTARWGLFSLGLRGWLRGKIDKAVLSNKLLFIHVPKNAGTSIATAIYGHLPPHTTAYFYRTVAPDYFEHAEAFAVLRDPVDRFVSAYWFVQNRGGDDVAMDHAFAKATSGIETVDQLLNFTAVKFKNLYHLDNVLRPQWWYVLGGNGELLVKRLFILGKDQDKMAVFLRNFGIVEIPIKNQTKKGSLVLTEAQTRRIRALYDRDVRLLEFVRQDSLHQN